MKTRQNAKAPAAALLTFALGGENAIRFPGAIDVRADLNNDSQVDFDDLFEILASWGPCA